MINLGGLTVENSLTEEFFNGWMVERNGSTQKDDQLIIDIKIIVNWPSFS